MAAKYQVNIAISAGANFAQEFYVTNPDMTPRDITGLKFAANLSKHATSINAVTSTSKTPVYKVIPFHTRVVDGKKGIVEISMSPHNYNYLKEGKNVYDVVCKEPSGAITNIVRGLAFVDKTFGHVPGEYIWDGGGAAGDDSCIILDGGTASL